MCGENPPQGIHREESAVLPIRGERCWIESQEFCWRAVFEIGNTLSHDVLTQNRCGCLTEKAAASFETNVLDRARIDRQRQCDLVPAERIPNTALPVRCCHSPSPATVARMVQKIINRERFATQCGPSRLLAVMEWPTSGGGYGCRSGAHSHSHTPPAASSTCSRSPQWTGTR